MQEISYIIGPPTQTTTAKAIILQEAEAQEGYWENLPDRIKKIFDYSEIELNIEPIPNHLKRLYDVLAEFGAKNGSENFYAVTIKYPPEAEKLIEKSIKHMHKRFDVELTDRVVGIVQGFELEVLGLKPSKEDLELMKILEGLRESGGFKELLEDYEETRKALEAAKKHSEIHKPHDRGEEIPPYKLTCCTGFQGEGGRNITQEDLEEQKKIMEKIKENQKKSREKKHGKGSGLHVEDMMAEPEE